MIILHICDWYSPIGGAEKLLFDTLNALEQNGHTNIVVYNDNPNQHPAGQRVEYAVTGLEFFVYFSPGVGVLTRQAIPKLKKIIDEHKPDVCHIHNFQNPIITEFLLGKIPCVRSIHDPRLYCFTNWRLLPDKSICPYALGPECVKQGCISSGLVPKTDFDRNAQWVLKHHELHKSMPVLIGESRAQIDCMMQNGFQKKQIAWLPNFTPIQPASQVRKYIRQHSDASERMVLFVGRASYEKGIHILIEACKHITCKCKIVIITAGPLLDEIIDQAKPFSDKIEIIPGLPYEQTREYYARASVVVVPSVWLENFCLVGLETYANMKPVIGSRIGGIIDWLKDGETGWTFNPGDPKDLAAKIDLAFEDPKNLHKIGEAAYERVMTHYNQELYTARLVNIYKRGIKRFNGNRII
ncbi:glycosyltransferase family 4 protein [Maridesulfovibrio frigidus]|uniref:glycosyltransferase family 4 protein n=1 Tax=Maridesulfovibrio frigidus TaxID=340956 RepID=UPI0004E2532B|nr:glycosyltransferase family 4 protein [Maridesulfovibrio frigidus]